ncbi:MAG: hypothetical protein GXO55_08295 [Chloroflexi bacterium]|nr:hypothetical protein [Chloroflexota bacterium]
MKATTRKALAVLVLLALLMAGYFVGSYFSRQTFATNNEPPIEFMGPVQAMPDDLWGTWQVGDQEVVVTRKTTLNTVAGRAQVGAFVQVRAHKEDDRLVADVIRVLSSEDATVPLTLHGIVESVGEGEWIIDGTPVRVGAHTRVMGWPHARPGLVATVQGHMEGTTFVADLIQLTTVEEESSRVEFIGVIQEVRGNNWVVNGLEIPAPPGATPPPPGSLVRVSGHMEGDNRLVPSTLSVYPPDVQLTGWLLDQETEGDVTQWNVLVEDGSQRGEEVLVRLKPDTPVDDSAGAAGAGARVAVYGAKQAQGVVEATFARVVEAHYAFLIGTLVYVPEDVYAYPWTVNDTQVWVRPDTISDRPLSEFKAGDRVAISGVYQNDGTFLAYMISHSKR